MLPYSQGALGSLLAVQVILFRLCPFTLLLTNFVLLHLLHIFRLPKLLLIYLLLSFYIMVFDFLSCHVYHLTCFNTFIFLGARSVWTVSYPVLSNLLALFAGGVDKATCKSWCLTNSLLVSGALWVWSLPITQGISSSISMTELSIMVLL